MMTDTNPHNNDAAYLKRLLARDVRLWSDDPDVCASINQRLGWLDAITFSRGQSDRIHSFRNRIIKDGFDRVVLLGMGGSSLAPEVFNQCFADAPEGLDMTVLDTTFPDSIARTCSALEHGRPLFIVSSKSGSTAETSALHSFFWQWCRSRFGDNSGQHFVAITDEHSSLHNVAVEDGFRDIFLNPADIGGRYSALSLFGLVPASLVGVDIIRLLDRARRMLDDVESTTAAVDLGILIGRRAATGCDKLALAFSPLLKSMGMWVEQLVAESTGKQGIGVVPFIREDHLPSPPFTDECVFVSTRLAGDDRSGREAGDQQSVPDKDTRPVVSITIDDVHDLGAEFMRWYMATAIAASIMGINPFDEPDVNATKQATKQILQNKSQPHPETTKIPTFDPSAMSTFLHRAKIHDYVALLAYLPTDQDWEQKLKPLRDLLQQRLNTVTCLALGPRYLHSSGQLHKGGKTNGHFLVLTARPRDDVPIPGEHYGFGVLIDAQAHGDLTVLRARGQNVLHFDLGPIDGAEAEIRKITDYLHRHL